MSGRGRVFAAAILALFLAGATFADTLELRDGRVLQGRYLGGTMAVLRFEVNGEVQTFSVNDAVAVTFTGGSGKSVAPAAAPAAPPTSAASQAPPPDSSEPPITSQDVPPSSGQPAAAPSAGPTPSAAARPAAAAPAEDPAAQYGEVTIPAGHSMLIRMIDGVDSSKNHVGDVFHASLETDLYVRGAVIARKGTDVYGRLANAQEAGKFSGSAQLQLELIRIVIDGRDYPLVSSDYTMTGQGRGADTAKKVGGGAVFGAIIGAIAGGGKGAAIGAGAGSAAGAGVQILTKGDKVKVTSETVLEFRLQQPAMVTPTQR